ncbi:bifunctional phosphopantothenoylcysteine decarboxylase/phosphopantothenate--cysteine ligase CoaBC [Riemerella columbina]|uniref:bifunctional phosphopantothenoylcysteine decarboxylase/phosphopantothenate--cysteine ligase CoaBC n=1 Tax=Riemerella columbina TaxID=103810 RepID=UPI00035C177E|nr:bifunctional phosphopantothenoylcysteine decarboxylase/phosphopantothenate--cysteine ligase CoaBC [Riemerella columbina]
MTESLNGKHILIAISGGIAAYKINNLIRTLVKAKAHVKVIMTPTATAFVSPLTLSTLSKNEVLVDLVDDQHNWNNHVELGLWADVMLVAPCTANTLAKMVHGVCDNLVVATYLSAKCPVYIAPAMDLDMYQHPSTKKNLELAKSYGNKIIPAESGELASGLVGEGRLAEPETIYHIIAQHFEPQSQPLKGKVVLITAGPTHEAIDPVRFIGNHSSGKMGFELAKIAAQYGAQVILISGPSAQQITHPLVTLHRVTSAQDMFDKVFEFYESVDIAIASAAVADYRPKFKADEKIKKQEDTLQIELVKNPDILKTMGEQKTHQCLVGFALETEHEIQHAKAKLEKKNLDMIVLNSLKDAGAGFKGDTNKIKIITKEEIYPFDLKSKSEVARDIIEFIIKSQRV